MSYVSDADDFHEHLAALRAGKRSDAMRMMRQAKSECPRYIRMDALNEEWAYRNHGQTLKRLNERGGLSPCEAAAIIECRDWHKMDIAAAVAVVAPFAHTQEGQS